MAEHHQCHRIGTCGSAAAAIGDDTLAESADAAEARAQLSSRQKFVRRRVKQIIRGEAHASCCDQDGHKWIPLVK
jgi:hypothetical protein